MHLRHPRYSPPTPSEETDRDTVHSSAIAKALFAKPDAADLPADNSNTQITLRKLCFETSPETPPSAEPTSSLVKTARNSAHLFPASSSRPRLTRRRSKPFAFRRLLLHLPPTQQQLSRVQHNVFEDFSLNPLSPEVWLAACAKCKGFSKTFSATAFLRKGPYLVGCIEGLCKSASVGSGASQTLLHNCHLHLTVGTAGKADFPALSKVYFWPGLRSFGQNYVESCEACWATKALTKRLAETPSTTPHSVSPLGAGLFRFDFKPPISKRRSPRDC